MKKYTIVLIAVALTAVFAVTAMANEWNLYGSARMGTYYINNKFGDAETFDAAGRSSAKLTSWALQGNSRIGATVKGENLSARFEYGTGVNLRRLYGVWNFTDGWGLKVGQDYTPITFFLSGQVFDNDAGLLNVGNAYGSRRGQVAVEGMGFKLAFIEQFQGTVTVLDPDGAGVGLDIIGVAAESYLPKIEASYLWKHGDMGGTHFFGGFQTTKQYFQQTNNATGPTPTVTQFSKTVNSWAVGLGGDYNFGPMFVRPQLSYYVNGGSAGWLSPFDSETVGSLLALPTLGASINPDVLAGQSVLVGTKLVDANAFMGMLALGFSPTEQLQLELGGGFLYNNEKDDTNLKDRTRYELYLNAVYTMAPGVFLVPEVGYRSFGEVKFEDATPNFDLGNLWYFGAKWQINF